MDLPTDIQRNPNGLMHISEWPTLFKNFQGLPMACQYPWPGRQSFLQYDPLPYSFLNYSTYLWPEFLTYYGASLVAQRLKPLPAMWEIGVRSLGQKDPLEKEMATHSSILARRIPCTKEPGGLQSMASQRVGHDWATSFTSLYFMKVKILFRHVVVHSDCCNNQCSL